MKQLNLFIYQSKVAPSYSLALHCPSGKERRLYKLGWGKVLGKYGDCSVEVLLFLYFCISTSVLTLHLSIKCVCVLSCGFLLLCPEPPCVNREAIYILNKQTCPSEGKVWPIIFHFEYRNGFCSTS